jgi:hypothetical protein
LENNNKVFKYLLSKDYLKKPDNSISDKGKSIYKDPVFNQYGDVISYLDEPSAKVLKDVSTFYYTYWQGIDEINRFNDYAKSMNVDVFFIFPCYTASAYNKNKEVIGRLESDMRKNLKVEMLCSPSDMVFPDSSFFDTVLSLR